jgi:hypothetical protein
MELATPTVIMPEPGWRKKPGGGATGVLAGSVKVAPVFKVTVIATVGNPPRINPIVLKGTGITPVW